MWQYKTCVSFDLKFNARQKHKLQEIAVKLTFDLEKFAAAFYAINRKIARQISGLQKFMTDVEYFTIVSIEN
ncbi:hypothetical protein T07_12509 [Trichinella nelsoni]|uniref:Uncharacterized protein n=1 Tax=Trichinella nelsoni TaxID=6336 RepID=A0A0V0SLB9_9BILA|nr:hypothetical protein T07_12509 [Trichinella nelsoni]